MPAATIRHGQRLMLGKFVPEIHASWPSSAQRGRAGQGLEVFLDPIGS